MCGKGYIHVYFGDGKGKTTAALGLALRASGCGKKVVIVQFLKDTNSGELRQLSLLPNTTVLRGKASGALFVRDMSEDQKAETKAIHNDNLRAAIELQKRGECDLLILDEVIDAYRLELLDAEMFNSLIDNKPEPLELVITGHKADSELIDKADYVTEMSKHKHPYDKGVPARRGIEF